MNDEIFRLGINYWPAHRAMFWWREFEVEEVERDFERLREAGFDLVRVFLLWEEFQPEPDRIASETIERLRAVADLAARARLQLLPTFFTGHMSGANWLPAWACEPSEAPTRFRTIVSGRVLHARPRNWYADPELIEAQARLVREVVRALGTHPALWGWDLGNEPSNCVIPPSHEHGLAWLERMVAEIRAAGSMHPITLGLHMEDLEEDRRLGPAEVARACDLLAMHGYPVYAEWAEGPTDAQLLPFLGLLTRWLGGGRDLLFEEFGAPTRPLQTEIPSRIPFLSEDDAARFTQEALALLHHFGFAGALLWCYSDYAPALWDHPPFDEAPHERFFGLWRADGTPKPVVDVVRTWSGLPRHAPHRDFTWIDIAPEEFFKSPRLHLPRLYDRFRREGTSATLPT
ncbi:MAG: beta-galactosidase [Blastocatellia bacterium]|nr:beta-galactosidase [Blastocatellia bacterium]MCS7156866.1 beta-galactosidase [Blastocatellia bacterium]MCX7752824.1 beta-galactosidase [Blastocatellia bacterium]MDW8167558.1 beta-galactosidase [Acidobacteriota bacterium]MDW8256158.1 beta-galactosidase [Acidobacteriota bacterium]